MAIDPRLWAIIRQYAPRYGLDPRAVASIAMNESGGRFGAVGDSGTSYGPWQLHVGGALPSGRGSAWANSLPGILYTFRAMANAGARGLHGQAAVAAIARNFERPANPGAEIATALRYYTSPGFARGAAAAGMGGGGSVGGGGAAAGGNGIARALAQIQAMRPIQLQPQAQLPTALGAIQNLIASQQPQTMPLAAPLMSSAPTSNDFSSQLDAIHAKLLR